VKRETREERTGREDGKRDEGRWKRRKGEN
jgi:hypothetical protein